MKLNKNIEVAVKTILVLEKGIWDVQNRNPILRDVLSEAIEEVFNKELNTTSLCSWDIVSKLMNLKDNDDLINKAIEYYQGKIKLNVLMDYLKGNIKDKNE